MLAGKKNALPNRSCWFHAGFILGQLSLMNLLEVWKTDRENKDGTCMIDHIGINEISAQVYGLHREAMRDT